MIYPSIYTTAYECAFCGTLFETPPMDCPVCGELCFMEVEVDQNADIFSA